MLVARLYHQVESGNLPPLANMVGLHIQAYHESDDAKRL